MTNAQQKKRRLLRTFLALELSSRYQAGTKNKCRQCWYICREEVESFYHIYGLLKSLPTWMFDRDRPRPRNETKWHLRLNRTGYYSRSSLLEPHTQKWENLAVCNKDDYETTIPARY